MFSERLKKCRKELGLTQEELANRLNTTKQTIYKYENEVVTNIPSNNIKELAKVLGVDPAYLMGWEERTQIDIEKLNKKNRIKLEEYFNLLLNSQD